jgi:hypothetical protein
MNAARAAQAMLLRGVPMAQCAVVERRRAMFIPLCRQQILQLGVGVAVHGIPPG